MLGEFKALTRKISKAYKKGQWNRFIISFLLLAQLGLLAIADGWASPLEDLKTPINAENICTAGMAGEPVRDAAQETTRDPAAEAALFQELLTVSGTDLDRTLIYAWVKVPQTSGYDGTEKGSQNLADRCRQKIVEQNEKMFGQKVKPQPNSLLDKHKTDSRIADSYLMETEQGESIKINTKRIGAASFYLLIEVSQIASVERAVLLRQLVADALKATRADVLSDSIEPGSIVTNGIDSEGTETESNAINPDGINPDGIKTNEIAAVPVKSSLNLTLSRSGHLTQTEQLQLVKLMLSAAGAGNSQGINSSELISLTAYTPRLHGDETLTGKPVNLQIASRYHSLDNRTYFQIGAPLLMIEY